MTKYQIRFFFEYGGGCLWGADQETKEKYGYSIAPEQLPLSNETIDQLINLETHFQTSLDRDYPPDPSPWSKQEIHDFMIEAEDLLNRIKTELKEEFEVHNEMHLYSLFNEDINFT